MSLRIEPSLAVREKRLGRLLAERALERNDERLARIVEDAELAGSLELAGIRTTWDEVRAASRKDARPTELDALRRARGALASGSPLTVAAITAWHTALLGPVGFRREPARGAPAELIEGRLTELALWLDAAGAEALEPQQKAAVALARIVEIRPFDDANGRVSRLAAAQIMRRAGLAPPILVAGDAPRLRAALEAAFRLETGPLVDLVREACGRALEVMIQSLERGLV